MADIKKDLIYAAGTDNGAVGDKITTASGNTYYIPMKREQSMGLVVVGGTGAAKITLKAGTEYKKSLGDNTIDVAAGKAVVIPLCDSARYKIGKGDYAGCIAFTTTAAVDVIPFVI